MRLSPVTTIKSKHLFPSSKMSLLKISNEKLNDIIADDCKDLPGLLASKAHVLAKQLYMQTEDHRRRLLYHLRKNWLRLMLSAVVLLAQFAWLTSNFAEPKFFDENEACYQPPQQQSQPESAIVAPHIQSDHHEQMLSSLGRHLMEYDPSVGTNNSDDDQAMIAGYDHHPFSAPSVPSINEHKNPLPGQSHGHNSRPSSFSDWFNALMWKAFLLCKLALIMLFFELIRLSDTVVNVIRQINDEEDEKQRSPPKSPVDTGYIERNRGYK